MNYIYIYLKFNFYYNYLHYYLYYYCLYFYIGLIITHSAVPQNVLVVSLNETFSLHKPKSVKAIWPVPSNKTFYKIN